MINRYRSVRQSVSAFSVADFAKAKETDSIASILNANKQIDAFVFGEDAELTKGLNALVIEAVEITPKKRDDGSIQNNATIVTTNGGKYFANVYGVKDAPLSKTFRGDELKTLKYGFCTSGGNKVTRTKMNPTTGELENVPIIYVCVA